MREQVAAVEPEVPDLVGLLGDLAVDVGREDGEEGSDEPDQLPACEPPP